MQRHSSNNSHASSVDSGAAVKEFSPISTLEDQYQTDRVLIFLRTNNHCWLPGGVEYILSQSSKQGRSLPPGGTTDSAAPAPSSDANASQNPFDFLTSSDSGAVPDDTNSSRQGNTKGFGRFLKKVAQSTTEKLERGMQNLAIKADKGRNPDIVCASLYDSNDQLLSMTESISYPASGSSVTGMHFVVPLIANKDANQIVVRLWIRSGATWLEKTNASKNYLLGQCTVSIQPGTFCSDLPLHSNWVVNGLVSVLMLPDTKFPNLCGRGWSLVDPVPRNNHFNLPLDQSYSFSAPSQAPNSFLVATERATESSIVLPAACAMAQLFHHACKVSWHHGQSVTTSITQSRHDVLPPNAPYSRCDVRVGALRCNPLSPNAAPVLSLSWQRPDSIFEVEICTPMSMPVNGNEPNISFFPKPCKEGVLPGILQLHGGRMPASGFLVGNLRMQLLWTLGPQQPPVIWDHVVSLDTLLADPTNSSSASRDYPLVNAAGQTMGTVQVMIHLQMQGMEHVPSPTTSARGGLVALMGLPRLVEFTHPSLDYDEALLEASISSIPDRERRKQQMATLGTFVTKAYMENHMQRIRAADVTMFAEKALRYKDALAMEEPYVKRPPSHHDDTPRPFRPSASRSKPILAGLPFNVHTSGMSLSIIDAEKITPEQSAVDSQAGACFFNTSCGAPSDHARDFSNIFHKEGSKEAAAARAAGLLGASPVGAVSGGLRRLEAKRQELATLVTNLQTALTMAVANFFVEKRQTPSVTPISHIPANHRELADIRWNLFEAVQSLHHVTWVCAARRAVCFSQALGTALSCFLSNVSDFSKWQSQFPELWARHGFLVCFEGLLSAAGKELGMIEDASVGIAMLSMVKVIFVPDNGSAPPTDSTPVVQSPYLKWLTITPSGSHPEREFTVQIGVVQSYYDQRMPPPLKSNTGVRLYPLLFEVGVDIRQWGAHTGSTVKSSLEEKWKNRNNPSNSEEKADTVDPSEETDDEDAMGATDDDFLVKLNSEAFHKLNAYAHYVTPPNTDSSSNVQQRVHPLLETLYQHIMSSAGKINHDIVDEAATIAQQLGGGGVVFCKSGKDRTAMHVTYKQAQFATRFRQQTLPTGTVVEDSTLSDAQIMRVHGTRLPVCEKNVGKSRSGQPKYAFNSLQVQFMPEKLKPPMNTLAGFLKGIET